MAASAAAAAPLHVSGLRGSSGRAVLSVRRGREILYVHDKAFATECLFGPTANPTVATNQEGSAQTVFTAALDIRSLLQGTLNAPCRHLRDAALQLRRCHAPEALLRRVRQLGAASDFLRHASHQDAESMMAQIREALDQPGPAPPRGGWLSPPGGRARDQARARVHHGPDHDQLGAGEPTG